MQKPENKEIVLLALYGEYIKDEGHFDLIRPQTVNMTTAAFRWAVMKLQTEGLVDGICLTKDGVAYVEEMLEAKGKRQQEKIIKVAEAFGSLLLDTLRTALLKQLD